MRLPMRVCFACLCIGIALAQVSDDFCNSQAVLTGNLDAEQKELAVQCHAGQSSSPPATPGRKLLQSCSANAWPSSSFAYGSGTADSTLFRNDDQTGDPVTLPSPLLFYGRTATRFFPNNNGIITFDKALSTYTPQAFPVASDARMIAPFWADVDTRPADGGEVYYRVSTTATDVNKAASVVFSSFPGTSVLGNPDYVIVMTWNNVGYFANHVDKRDSFQVMVAKFPEHTYSCFFYRCMEWTTGDASSGTGGFSTTGTTAAEVGFDSGDGTNYYAAPLSLSNAILGYVNSNRQLCYEITNNPLPAVESRCPFSPDCSGLTGNARDRCSRCRSSPCRGCMKLANSLQSFDQNAYNNMPDRCLQSGTNVYALNCLCDIASSTQKLGMVRSFTTNFLDRCTRCPNPGSQDNCAKCITCEFCTANAANQWNQNTIENCVTNPNPLSVCATDYSLPANVCH